MPFLKNNPPILTSSGFPAFFYWGLSLLLLVEALKEKGALDEVSEEVPVPEELPGGVKERIRKPETSRP